MYFTCQVKRRVGKVEKYLHKNIWCDMKRKSFCCRFVPSVNQMEISWEGFLFVKPILFYQYGIGTFSNDIGNLSCSHMVRITIYYENECKMVILLQLHVSFFIDHTAIINNKNHIPCM